MRLVYNSFHGRFSDNPRAIFEALRRRSDIEHVWLADHRHVDAFPPDATLVDIDGPDARRALERADLVVANTHTEVAWHKPSSTCYLQTWHGTPLKRVHHDVLWAPEDRLARLDQDVARWDLLISPNEPSTPRLRGAFRFEGRIEQTGYPRNDLLLDPTAPAVRESVRRRLGLRPDSTVVLYAPTWRDDECFDPAGADIPSALDLATWSRTLGPSHELLVRSHSMVTGRTPVPELAGVIDASLYPDVRDLYLVADVLVTDYSSAMFDFAVTGKPMVFFAYDLERFRSSTRGFYFDFLPEAPGPVVETVTDLLSAVTAVDEHASTYAEKAAAFRLRYCALEDGHATERVIAAVGL